MIGKTEILHLYLNDSKLNAPLTTKELKVQLMGLDHRMVSREFRPLVSNPYSGSINKFFFFFNAFLKNCKCVENCFYKRVLIKKVYAPHSQFTKLWKCGKVCDFTHEFHKPTMRGFFLISA